MPALRLDIPKYILDLMQPYFIGDEQPSEKQRSTDKIGSAYDGLRLSVVQQVIVIVLTVGMLDGGALFQTVVYAILGYWAGILMIRRRLQTTPLDNFLIRWGFIILCVISFAISNAVWTARHI
jgi:hypothetical protein